METTELFTGAWMVKDAEPVKVVEADLLSMLEQGYVQCKPPAPQKETK